MKEINYIIQVCKSQGNLLAVVYLGLNYSWHHSFNIQIELRVALLLNYIFLWLFISNVRHYFDLFRMQATNPSSSLMNLDEVCRIPCCINAVDFKRTFLPPRNFSIARISDAFLLSYNVPALSDNIGSAMQWHQIWLFTDFPSVICFTNTVVRVFRASWSKYYHRYMRFLVSTSNEISSSWCLLIFMPFWAVMIALISQKMFKKAPHLKVGFPCIYCLSCMVATLHVHLGTVFSLILLITRKSV